MKTCPKCSKRYDDSWKLCFHCEVPLAAGGQGEACDPFAGVKKEIGDVREAITGLHKRLDRIEYFLDQKDKILTGVQATESKDTVLETDADSLSVTKKITQPSERCKAFTYRWKTHGRELVGEYRCSNKIELLGHIKDLGGELVEILSEKEAQAPKVSKLFVDKPQQEEEPQKKSGIREEVKNEVIRQKKSLSENFEQALGEKWFNKLGIFAVVIGVALLIGYSFQYLGAAGKLAVGFAFGAGMLLFGHFIEKKENFLVYGKGLVGGGWAITYFTVFAMHHIPAVRFIHHPLAGMLLLLSVSAATVADVYRYRSQVAIGFSYLLVFITLMISPVSIYTMAAAVPVLLSLLFFMIKMEWNEFGLCGMFMTYLTYSSWFKIDQLVGRVSVTQEQFFIAGGFLLLYWILFTVSALVIKDNGKTPLTRFFSEIQWRTPSVLQVANTVIVCYLGRALIHCGFTRYYQPVLLGASLIYLALTALTYAMKKRELYNIHMTAAVALASVFLWNRYTGYSLTVAYLLLTQALLLAGIFFKEKYWRIFSFASLAVLLGKLLVVDGFLTEGSRLPYHLNTRTLLFGFAFVLYLANHFLYTGLRRHGLLSETEQKFSRAIAYGFPLIYVMGTWLDLPKVLTAPAWALLGVVLLVIGVWKNAREQRRQGYYLTVGAFVRLLLSNMVISGGISHFSYRILTVVPVLLVLYYCVLLYADEKTKSILEVPEKKMTVIFPSMVFIGLMTLVWYEAPKDLVAPVWALLAVLYAVRGIFSSQKHYLTLSSFAAVLACARALFVNLFQNQYLVGGQGSVVWPLAAVGLLFLGNILYAKLKGAAKEEEDAPEGMIRSILHSPKLIYGLSAIVLLTALLADRLRGVLLTAGLGIEGLLLLLCGMAIKEKHWRISGLLVLLLTLAKVFLKDLRQLSALYYILSLIALGIALLFVSYIYTRYKDKIKKLI